MNCLEALIGLRLPTPRLKTMTEKEGEEYIDFYWKFEAVKKDESTRTLKKSSLNKRRLPSNTSYGVKKFEDINSWLQSQQNPQYSIDCQRKSHSDEEEPLRIKDPKIGSYSPKKAEALYLRRLSRPMTESSNPIMDPYSSFSFPSPSLSTRPATLPLIHLVNS